MKFALWIPERDRFFATEENEIPLFDELHARALEEVWWGRFTARAVRWDEDAKDRAARVGQTAMSRHDHRPKEPGILVNGVTLTEAQAVAVRVAVSAFLAELETRDLGVIGPLYRDRLDEVERLMLGIAGGAK
jgi:hypothetical protein